MKKLFILCILVSACNSKPNPAVKTSAVKDEIGAVEEENLAEKYGADEYGMRQYVMAFLYRGNNREKDSTKAMELQKAHLENINRMAEEGVLVLAGPFLDDSYLRGIYVFDVKTIEEAKKLTETDPAIQSGQLRMELKPWYGTAGLKAINEIHEKLETKNVAEQ